MNESFKFLFLLVVFLVGAVCGMFLTVFNHYTETGRTSIPVVTDNSTQVRLDACIGKLYELQNKYWVNGSWCGK